MTKDHHFLLALFIVGITGYFLIFFVMKPLFPWIIELPLYFAFCLSSFWIYWYKKGVKR